MVNFSIYIGEPNYSRKIGFFLILALTLTLFFSPTIAQDSIFLKKVSVESKGKTIYQTLNQISDSIGYFFIYDSRVVDSDKCVQILVKDMPLRMVLNTILNDSTIRYKTIKNHILIYKNEVTIIETDTPPKPIQTIKGQVFDAQTKEPIPYVSVGIVELGIGNVTNSDGLFILKVPDGVAGFSLTVSHIGYKSQNLPAELITKDKIDIFLNVEHISIQEVIIRNVDPLSLIKQALRSVPDNYMQSSAYLTTFYREGVQKGNKYINYSEGVFKVYKSAYSKGIESDQLKLLKSRKIQNIDRSDTLIVKLKGGLSSSLILDIIKNPPTFLDPDFFQYYNYYKYDITTINNRSAYAIEFEQKETVSDPLFKGVIYIDMESLAILGATFQINPKHVKKSADQLIAKRNRKYVIKPEVVNYSVSYNEINGYLYLSHIRGDLVFKYRKRRQLFFSSFKTFMEMATSSVDTVNVKRFFRREVEKTSNVFLDNSYEYDDSFWADFNHIAPEDNLYEMLKKINLKIEQTSPEELD
ncbi:MAG TPA: carboxypeptidase-like regulatory domain-containing protein [Tenuifilaceae bacterium]|nr:carboxypeptidase-like regulatory domain-containing protein [Tenuifilaceae bacterium]HPE17749.1 carboxypeptidase-like regulatory domain-containing protein [Tenuifilaceae bacterium]HPJ46426.1 carboxypeptidase-like regulatory domain-containing protein [Tenuifilaceae bacterium]HPQ34991.1 carboxypeptidase-like regulatory domain-containing protein [Tenuifilaceae bacterium]HRX68665.1 carboxypeptidase-like regulatory domain-containing protein [Tenuifilaceae bacterium]